MDGAGASPAEVDAQHLHAAQLTARSKAAMERLIRLHRDGVYRPSVGDVLPFAEIATAHARAGSRHRRGNTVVLITR